MTEVKEYVDASGSSPFAKWFEGLNREAALKVTSAIRKIQAGNKSNMESIGNNVHELKIHSGPGYRIYFGNDGETLVILLGGGTKKRQSADIKEAKACWAEYEKRKSSQIN